jgi:nucleotide-binding universal stress UspA family protein
MKSVLIATDFSEKSKHAARYGYALACQIKSNVVLCNAVIVPAEIPQAGIMMWPMDEYDLLLEDSSKELARLKKSLGTLEAKSEFKPQITSVSEAGEVSSVVNDLLSRYETDLVVIGTHRHNGINEILLSNHACALIDSVSKPLLLISSHVDFKPIKKIAFATDFENIEEDLKTIYELIPFAKKLGAEILLTHITKGKYESEEHRQLLSRMLVDLSNKADYPYIYYRLIRNQNAEAGLDWICRHGQVDMLAMAHRRRGFLFRLFKGSHAKKMAENVGVPLLVFNVNP